ncbi:DUF4423 domain-containing protein [Bdellovibrio sp. 22V]|uniref:DUF4423 domain-containing protein n=1 Tax=Bdellovibrio TaxID=958 RepID=UPI002542CF71|nr:DUF4423 domain-containing protein [Bdellovibrio sp. 22V]WII71549.1 DUF4423 domain-containing protein [Bdellovibrio sp. 22V]
MSNVGKILQYDIKEFLARIIEHKKQKNPRFSQRAFANQIGLTSTTLNEILKGKRRISAKTMAKLKAAFAQNEELLQLLDNQNYTSFSTFHVDTSALRAPLSSWFHIAILELMQTENFCEDPAWIAKRLGISIAETTQALEDLLKIEAIKRNQFNKLIPTHSNQIKFADDSSRESMLRTHNEFLKIVGNSVSSLPLEKISCGYLLVAASEEDRDYILAKSLSFVRECEEYLGRANVSKKEVFLLNVNFVPVTKTIPDDP